MTASPKLAVTYVPAAGFCPTCRGRFSAASTSVPLGQSGTSAPTTPMETVLGLLHPLDGGEAMILTKPRLLIGRAALCDIKVASDQVAPVHCRLYVDGSAWYVRSISIERETRVNAAAVIECRLATGDLLWLSDAHAYRIQYDPDALAAERR